MISQRNLQILAERTGFTEISALLSSGSSEAVELVNQINAILDAEPGVREYKYISTIRPPHFGGSPAGATRFEEYTGPGREWPHGVVVYPAKLSERDIDHYSFLWLPNAKDQKQLILDIVDKIEGSGHLHDYLQVLDDDDDRPLFRQEVRRSLEKLHVYLTEAEQAEIIRVVEVEMRVRSGPKVATEQQRAIAVVSLGEYANNLDQEYRWPKLFSEDKNPLPYVEDVPSEQRAAYRAGLLAFMRRCVDRAKHRLDDRILARSIVSSEYLAWLSAFRAIDLSQEPAKEVRFPEEWVKKSIASALPYDPEKTPTLASFLTVLGPLSMPDPATVTPVVSRGQSPQSPLNFLRPKYTRVTYSLPKQDTVYRVMAYWTTTLAVEPKSTNIVIQSTVNFLYDESASLARPFVVEMGYYPEGPVWNLLPPTPVTSRLLTPSNLREYQHHTPFATAWKKIPKRVRDAPQWQLG